MEINNSSTNPTVVDETAKTLVNKGEFGKLLRDARNEKQLTTEKVSEDTYIKERQLIALEEEDFDNLPQMTFARGFAIKYAQYLQLDEKEIAENRGGHRKFSINPVLLLACIGVFAFAIFLVYIVSSAEEEQNQPIVAEEEMINSSEQQKKQDDTDKADNK